jgi:hypothetical protein
MRNTEKVHRSAAPNLLVQFPLAELTLQLAVDPSKSRRSIPARADGKSRRSIPAKADGRSQQEPTVDPNIKGGNSSSNELVFRNHQCIVKIFKTKFWSTISLRFFQEKVLLVLLNTDTPFKSDKHFTLIYLSVLDDQFITDGLMCACTRTIKLTRDAVSITA